MALTTFYALFLGYASLITGIIFLIQPRHSIATIRELINDRSTIFVAGLMGILLGLAIVIPHNIWTGSSVTVLVTILGWLILIRSITLVLLPHAALRRAFRALTLGSAYWVMTIMLIALGVYLTVMVG